MNETKIVSVRGNLHHKVEVFVDPDKLFEDVGIDHINVSESFSNQMPLVVYYGEMLARAESQASEAKTDLAHAEAAVIKSLRAIYDAKGVKAAETRLEKEVALDPRFQDAQWRLRDARYVVTLIQSVVTAFDHRRSMLNLLAKSDQAMAQGPMRVTVN
jgi:hypothetical protein